MNQTAKDILMHYGTPRHSGRYPWGSGEDPYQHGSGDFLSRIDSLKKSGLSETEIAKSMGMSTTELRAQRSIASRERRLLKYTQAKTLKERGLSNVEIAREMGLKNESSVRSLLKEDSAAKMTAAKKTADFIKEQVDKKGMIDVGAGVEVSLGVSKEKLRQALDILQEEGYPVYGGRVPQATNKGKQTTLKVICPPGTQHKDIYTYDKINTLEDYISYDDGATFKKAFVYPASMDSKRLQVRYAEDGGIEKDGVIELRRGVPDLSLGNSHYAQVRILVDNDRYLKGMAIYSDDMPDGIDVIFNTNKKKGTPVRDVLKPIKDDPSNPFGSLIKEHGGQSYYIDKDGKEKLSLINKRAEEGDWGEWSKNLSAQFLSKQNISLIRKQLNLAAADKKAEFDTINSLTNPTVKKYLLESFAEDCDSAAVHLKAAALPRQRYQVILPITSMKDTEVYAPNYRNGERVALIRYPHGGTFEIPILTVNNKQSDAKRTLGNAKDVIGINSKVAERLSGADFDGDTVMVIPTGKKIHITSTPPLRGLKDFDPKAEYPYREGMKVMKNTNTEMGKISNLITDMTLKGATDDELARAVKHSMVVIDAEKHKLDYKKSEYDNNIKQLKEKYQANIGDDGEVHYGGASTLISRSKSTIQVPKRKGSPKINDDGSLSWTPADDLTYIDPRTGETKKRTQTSTRMAETKDARSLSSGTLQEEAYADYANRMKALANEARKEMVSIKGIRQSPSAKKTYAKEVESLNSQVMLAKANAPKERKAQLMANSKLEALKKDNEGMSKKELGKKAQQFLVESRAAVGAKRDPVTVSDREWEAIQAGAISETKLREILRYTDTDAIKQRAMPRETGTLSPAQINKIKAMDASGYTNDEIAEALGKSVSTVIKYL